MNVRYQLFCPGNIYHERDKYWGSLFTELGYFTLQSEEFRNTSCPVCIYRKDATYPSDTQYILYNTEQTTSENFNYELMLDKDIKEIWDYSPANIKNLNKKGIMNTRLVVPTIWNDYKNKLLSYNPDNTYDYDVIFVGMGSDRRWEITEKLLKLGLRVKTVMHNVAYGEDRDKLIAKSKIYLNIHFKEEWNIFERIRLFPWIGVNKLIVSENSVDNDPACINVDYNNIIDTVLKLV